MMPVCFVQHDIFKIMCIWNHHGKHISVADILLYLSSITLYENIRIFQSSPVVGILIVSFFGLLWIRLNDFL